MVDAVGAASPTTEWSNLRARTPPRRRAERRHGRCAHTGVNPDRKDRRLAVQLRGRHCPPPLATAESVARDRAAPAAPAQGRLSSLSMLPVQRAEVNDMNDASCTRRFRASNGWPQTPRTSGNRQQHKTRVPTPDRGCQAPKPAEAETDPSGPDAGRGPPSGWGRRAGSDLPCRAASRSPSPPRLATAESVARGRAAPARGRLSCPAGQHAVVASVSTSIRSVCTGVVPRIERDHRRWSARMPDLVIFESPGKTRKDRPGPRAGLRGRRLVRARARPAAAEARRRLAGRAAPADCPGLDLTGDWKPSWEVIDSKSKTVEMRHVSYFPGSCHRAPSCASSAGGCGPLCPRGDRAGAGRAAGRRQTGAGSPRTDPVCVPTVDRQDECFGSEDAPGFPAVPSVCPARWSR